MKLEDLFKIKKAEIPTKEDWQKFDDRLKGKMLLALMKKEPFYKRVFSKFGVMRKPAIATAVALPMLALSVLFTGTPQTTANTSALISQAVIMPAGTTSFAKNEIASESAENPLSMQLDFSDNSRINYATHVLTANANFVF